MKNENVFDENIFGFSPEFKEMILPPQKKIIFDTTIQFKKIKLTFFILMKISFVANYESILREFPEK